MKWNSPYGKYILMSYVCTKVFQSLYWFKPFILVFQYCLLLKFATCLAYQARISYDISLFNLFPVIGHYNKYFCYVSRHYIVNQWFFLYFGFESYIFNLIYNYSNITETLLGQLKILRLDPNDISLNYKLCTLI